MSKLPFFLALLSFASLSNATRIVVNSDEWAFSEGMNYGYGGSSFANGNDGAVFAINVAAWLTEGAATRDILIGSNHWALTGPTFQNTLISAGYSITNSSSAKTLAQLQEYAAVFVSGPSSITSELLLQYVNSGGNVYVAAGTGSICDECVWDPFLHGFGLDFGGENGIGHPYTAATMSFPTSGSHPILAGIDRLQFGNANTVYDINAADARGQVVASYQGIGLLGVYDGNSPVGAVPEPGSLALFGLGCVSLALAFRRRRT